MADKPDIVNLDVVANAKLDAAGWLAKLDRGNLSDDERLAFTRWLAEDEQHMETIRQVASMWYGMNYALSKLSVEDIKTQHRGSPFKTRAVAFLNRLFSMPSLAITVAVSFCVGVILAYTITAKSPEPAVAYFSTSIGETRKLAFPDGSQAHLNTGSAIELSFSSRERAVRMLKGEAVFDVAHEGERPFVVYTAGGVIRAVGTRFIVKMTDDDVVVTVTEGKVELAERGYTADERVLSSDSGGAQPRSILIAEGQSSRLADSKPQPVHSVTESELTRKLSWTQGKLIFKNRELSYVINEVSRYTPVTISIVDEQLKRKKITGILPIGDIETMLEGIELSLGIKADRVSDKLIYLTKG